MKHLTDSDIKRFYSHSLRQEEEMSLLEHTAKCNYCAGRLASAFPESELLTPPPDLQDDILNAAKKIPSRKEMRLEFYRYSTKVVLAAGMALSLLVLGNFSENIFGHIPIGIEIQPEKKTTASDIISTEKKAYQETIQKKKAENEEAQKKFLQEKKLLQQEQKQNEQKKENEESSDNISKSLKNFSSGILSYFKK